MIFKISNVVSPNKHCVKCVQIRSFFWSVFGHFSRREILKDNSTKFTFIYVLPMKILWEIKNRKC